MVMYVRLKEIVTKWNIEYARKYVYEFIFNICLRWVLNNYDTGISVALQVSGCR